MKPNNMLTMTARKIQLRPAFISAAGPYPSDQGHPRHNHNPRAKGQIELE